MQDRLTAEAVEDWRERLQSEPDTPIRFEAEFWYRNDKARRESVDPLDDGWWREPAPNARPHRPRLDHFLAHVLTAETGEKISVRELYAEYRAFAVPKGRPRFDDIEKELKLLEHYAPLYKTLEGRAKADPVLYRLGRKLAEWQVTTVFPIAMQIGGSKLPAKEKKRLCRLIYSFLARRAMCGLTTMVRHMTPRLASRMRGIGAPWSIL